MLPQISISPRRPLPSTISNSVYPSGVDRAARAAANSYVDPDSQPTTNPRRLTVTAFQQHKVAMDREQNRKSKPPTVTMAATEGGDADDGASPEGSDNLHHSPQSNNNSNSAAGRSSVGTTLQDDIHQILRTKGKLGHHLLVPFPPPPPSSSSALSPHHARGRAGRSGSPAVSKSDASDTSVGLHSPSQSALGAGGSANADSNGDEKAVAPQLVLPTIANASVSKTLICVAAGAGNGSESRVKYLGVQAVAYAPPEAPLSARSGGGFSFAVTHMGGLSVFALIYVTIACAKFKKMLRRRTQWEQRIQYEKQVAKTARAREGVINGVETTHYTERSAKHLILEARRQVTNTLHAALKKSDEKRKLMKLNPRADLGALERTHSVITDTLSRVDPVEAGSLAGPLGVRPSFRSTLGAVLSNTMSPNDTTTQQMLQRDNSLITLMFQHEPSASAVPLAAPPSYPNTGKASRFTSNEGSTASPRASVSNPYPFAESTTDIPMTTVSDILFGSVKFQHGFDATSGGAGASTTTGGPLTIVPPGSKHRNRDSLTSTNVGSPLRPPTQGPVAVYQQYHDKNVFVLNTSWQDMEYRPLADRNNKRVEFQPKSHESRLTQFTQYALPTSEKRLQVKYEGGATGTGKGSGLNHVKGGTKSGNDGDNAQPHALEFLAAANPDIRLADLPQYTPGVRSTERSVPVDGLRATSIVAKPAVGEDFSFAKWRQRQNQALFHHLCAEHRHIEHLVSVAGADTHKALAASTRGGGANHSNSTSVGGSPQQTPGAMNLSMANENVAALKLHAKELQAIRERIRRRGEEIGFNAKDSATTTYDKFMVLNVVEHAQFLRDAAAEMERLLTAKHTLTRQAKRDRVLEKLDQSSTDNVLPEMFRLHLRRLDKAINEEVHNTQVHDNVDYNLGWIATLKNRVEMAFDYQLPQPANRIFTLATECVERHNNRDLSMKDFANDVFAKVSNEDLLLLPVQFVLERLLPLFGTEFYELYGAVRESKDGAPLSATLTKAEADANMGMNPHEVARRQAKVRGVRALKDLLSARKIPYGLLTNEDEAEIKRLQALSIKEGNRLLGNLRLHRVEELNDVFEPILNRQSHLGLNEAELAKHRLRAEQIRFKIALGASEDASLMRAASFIRRGSKAGGGTSGNASPSRSLSLAAGGAGGDAQSPFASSEAAPQQPRRRSTVVVPPLLGVSGLTAAGVQEKAPNLLQRFGNDEVFAAATARNRRVSINPSVTPAAAAAAEPKTAR